VDDFAAGAPNYRPVGGGGTPTTGAVLIIDGASHAGVFFVNGYANSHLGESVVGVGDQDGDGLPEVAASAPHIQAGDVDRVHVIPGSAWGGVPGLSLLPHWTYVAACGCGVTLASGFDLDGDARFDLAIGEPHSMTPSGSGSGFASEAGHIVVKRADALGATFFAYYAGSPGEHLGSSIAGGSDYDGDGVVDLLVGAPGWNEGLGAEAGRVMVLSGARLLAHVASPELAILTIPFGTAIPTDMHFGAALSASADLNGDGVGEILAGAPDFSTFGPSGVSRGALSVFSGRTLVRIGGHLGAKNDRLGDALAGGFQDLNGDGFLEFALAGSSSNDPSLDCGKLECLSLFSAGPSPYCTAKTNSLGCVPSMSWSGLASASSSAPFLATCASVLNQKSGLLVYANAPAATAFQGGTLCVATPLKRTDVQSSGGSASGADCSERSLSISERSFTAAPTRRSSPAPRSSRSTGRAIRSRRARRACPMRCVS
jgi:hypothetical protein